VRIGLDFDNTIVSYDGLFHQVARERGLIPEGLPETKLAVRDHLRAIGQEPVWTEMQGYVYGARMLEARAFVGVTAFLSWAQRQGIEVAIVSHKTRHPFIGPPYDLHAIAREWVRLHLSEGGRPLILEERVFFELTKEEKLARIAAGGFDLFLDDLPEILTAPAFPAATLPVLFDPARSTPAPPGTARVCDWAGLREMVGARWMQTS